MQIKCKQKTQSPTDPTQSDTHLGADNICT